MGAHTEGWYHNKCIITTKKTNKKKKEWSLTGIMEC